MLLYDNWKLRNECTDCSLAALMEFPIFPLQLSYKKKSVFFAYLSKGMRASGSVSHLRRLRLSWFLSGVAGLEKMVV